MRSSCRQSCRFRAGHLCIVPERSGLAQFSPSGPIVSRTSCRLLERTLYLRSGMRRRGRAPAPRRGLRPPQRWGKAQTTRLRIVKSRRRQPWAPAPSPRLTACRRGGGWWSGPTRSKPCSRGWTRGASASWACSPPSRCRPLPSRPAHSQLNRPGLPPPPHPPRAAAPQHLASDDAADPAARLRPNMRALRKARLMVHEIHL